MALNQAKELLCVMKNEDYKKLVDLASKNKSKKVPYTFKDAIRNLSGSEIDKLWSMLNKMVEKKAEVLLDGNKDTSNTSLNNKTCTELNQVLNAAIDLASVVFEESMPASQDLLHMIVFLNGILFEIPISIEQLRNSIAHLCEKMYHLNYVVNLNQYLIHNVVIYLLKRTLTRKAIKTDVKRIYAMRSVIPKILEMSEINPKLVWELLKKCATSHLYLCMQESFFLKYFLKYDDFSASEGSFKSKNGQKIIALTLSADVKYVATMHEAIKQKLLSGSLEHGVSYGKIYYEAYTHSVKTNNEKLKNELEMICLQDIILTAIQSRDKKIVLVLQKMLGQFHYQKKEVYISKMLYFLYQPILWRYLKNPDGLIRSNAAQLFLDVFPLEDPDIKVVATDQELNEQLLMIKDLLLDDFPIVRTTAVIGTCIAMSVNWELFPEEMLRTYFKIIVNDLSYDSSSSDVRCAVAKGLKVLLENPLTLPTLQGVLPKVQGLFHDISDSVRIAFCQLLLRVKKISAIKYFDIVPLDHLLARLEEDTAINKFIVTLIHNSYFPQQEMAHVWIARCLELIKTDRGASRILFQYVPSDIGIKSTVRFMSQCLKTIHTFIKAKISAKNICTLSSRRSSINKAIRFYEELRIFDDQNMVAGVLDAVVIMFHAVSPYIRKPENKEHMKEFVGQCTKYLGDLSIYFKDSPEWHSIYILSSFMPAYSVPTLGSLCFFRLKTLPSDAEYDDYITLLECLCNQGQGLQLLNLIQEWVEVGLLQKWKMTPPTPLPSKRRSTRGSRKSDSSGYDSSNEKCEQDKLSDICEKITSDKVIYLPKPELSAQLMNAVLNSYVCQKTLLKSNCDELKYFLNFTDILKKRIEELETKRLNSAEWTFLKDLCIALLTIAVLLHGEEKYEAVKYIEDWIIWFQKYMDFLCVPLNESPTTAASEKNSRKKRKQESFQESQPFQWLILNICKGLIHVAADMTVVGFVDKESRAFFKFTITILELELGPHFLLPICKFLFKHISEGEYLYLKEDGNTILLEPVPAFLHKILGCLNDENFFKKMPAADMKEIQYVLDGLLHVITNESLLRKELRGVPLEIVKCITSSILEDSNCVQCFKESSEPLDKIPIPKHCDFFIGIMCLKYKTFVTFLKELCYWCIKSVEDKESPDDDFQLWIACCVILFNVFRIKGLSKGAIRTLAVTVGELEKLLLKWYPIKESETVETTKLRNVFEEDEQNNKLIEEDEVIKDLSIDKHWHSEFEKLKNCLSLKISNLKK